MSDVGTVTNMLYLSKAIFIKTVEVATYGVQKIFLRVSASCWLYISGSIEAVVRLSDVYSFLMTVLGSKFKGYAEAIFLYIRRNPS